MTWAFLIFCIVQVGTPGPANMAMLATGARYGLRRVMPFVLGVAVSKQFIIWPLGFGLLTVAQTAPVVFTVLQYASAAYICYLAWRVAGMSFGDGTVGDTPPGFAAGLIVHPLNPKAWGVVTAGFANFVPAGMGVTQGTVMVALGLLAVQLILHPVWAGAGQVIAGKIKGTSRERPFFVTLALLTVAAVFYALFGGSS